MSTTTHQVFKKQRKALEKQIKEMLTIPSIFEYAELLLKYGKDAREENGKHVVDRLAWLEDNDADVIKYCQLYDEYLSLARF